MEYKMICDEDDIPEIVQEVNRLYNGKYRALLFDDSVMELYDYEISRQLGKPIELASWEEIVESASCLAERVYRENHFS